MKKSRRHNHSRKKSRVNFAAVIVIITIAVIMGIMTAKLIIYFINLTENNGVVPEPKVDDSSIVTTEPAILSTVSDSEFESNTQTTGSGVDVIEDRLVSGYYIQYGSFSTSEAAEALVSELSASGISAQVIEKSGTYKVVGQLFADKAAARKALESVDRSHYKDVFVTMI